ncbi:MAG TPA: phosphate ABC transporter ATP-binding protein PstB [Thermoplasmata archaeon]|nr:phosphate ABC transporter ATP-binding protein PstB [Thermoplasmata archaeon]
MEDKIVTQGLNAYFGDVHAIKGVDIRIPENAITAIIGPSGCGKSTLIRCMNRMHEIVRGARVGGKVLLDGKDIYAPGTDAVMVRTKVGMVFQKPNPFPTMSIYDNTVAGLRLTGVKDWKVLDDTVEKSLKLAALWDEVKHNLDASGVSISGGQQQRLCIARALAVEPEVLLLDEPCSALDPIATAKIEDLLFDLKDRYTIVIVTHNMQQAARVADYTAFMYMGELVEFGVTKSIFENPEKELTEKYITGRFG